MKSVYIVQNKRYDKSSQQYEWSNFTVFTTLSEFQEYWKWLEKMGYEPFDKQYRFRLIEKQIQ